MPAPTIHTTLHEVRGHGGVRLSVRECGDPAGPPILLVHGWSQSRRCWERQLADPALADGFRLVAPDLRGHGASVAPTDPTAYTDPQAWADDLAAIIDQLELDGATLVVWSYGGFVATDYVRAHGEAALAGIDLVGAAVVLDPAFEYLGPGLLTNAADMCSPHLETAIPAVERFLAACTARPLPADEHATALAYNMAVRPDVRAALIARQVDGTDVLGELTIPVLVSHGRADDIVLPSMAEHVLAHCRAARASWYDGVGHAPFAEDARRFTDELAAFAAAAAAG